jgi:hypothetical protein
MALEVLIPESFLAEKDDEIKELVRVPAKTYAVESEDDSYGAAFRNFLLFAHCPDYLADHFPGLDRATVFYNQYYWFVRFSRLYMKKHGKDAGLEQQAFQMVENADCEIDLTIIDSLETPQDAAAV